MSTGESAPILQLFLLFTERTASLLVSFVAEAPTDANVEIGLDDKAGTLKTAT